MRRRLAADARPLVHQSRIIHQLTAEMRTAVRLIVQDGLPRAEAAKLARLSDDEVREELRDNFAVRAFWDAQIKLLIDRAKPRAIHVMVKEGVLATTLRLAWRRP